MRYDVTDKVVLVTGAARGIGAETARLLAGRGARLSLVGMEPDLLADVAAGLGGRHAGAHAWFECDVTDQSALDAAVACTVERFGGIDVVVANAGIANNGTVAVNPPDAVARTIEVNLIGATRTVGATLPHVTARRGYYLLVSSAAAFTAMPGMAAYCASKAGLEHFGNALRLEVAHKGVDVGTAHMTWIDTDLVRDQKAESSVFAETLRKLPGPLGAYTSVPDCAAAFGDAVARRRRKVFVPGSLAVVSALRTALLSRLGELPVRMQAKTLVPRLEREVTTLGRSFGSSSVGEARRSD